MTTSMNMLPDVREAHASATSMVDCDLIWDRPFADSNYSFVINGFDGDGNPVMLSLISQTSTKIVIRTMSDAYISALARPKIIA